MKLTCSLLMEKKTQGNGREGEERRRDSKSGMKEDEENFELWDGDTGDDDDDVTEIYFGNVNVGFKTRV